jgi:hypothetical protein
VLVPEWLQRAYGLPIELHAPAGGTG